MLRTRVPEAPVNEDDETCSTEHDVRPAGEIRHPHTKPKTSPVQLTPERQLRFCIAPRHALHLSGDEGTQRTRSLAATRLDSAADGLVHSEQPPI